MCTCIYCVLYSLYCVFVLFRLCIFILSCFVCTGVRTTGTECELNCSNNNSNSHNKCPRSAISVPQRCLLMLVLSLPGKLLWSPVATELSLREDEGKSVITWPEFSRFLWVCVSLVTFTTHARDVFSVSSQCCWILFGRTKYRFYGTSLSSWRWRPFRHNLKCNLNYK